MVEVGKIRDKTLVLNGGYISIFRGGKLVWKKRYMVYLLPDGNPYVYRRRVRITELSGKTLTDYQIKIEIGAGDPIFAHARYAGEDIRFCYYPEESMLSYWIEKFDPVAEEAIIWVKVPEIPANSEIEIYMYYGNPEVASASDGVAVFDFFDDFEDGDISDWIYDDAWSVSSETALGIYSLKKDDPSDTVEYNAEKSFTVQKEFVLEGYIYVVSTNGGQNSIAPFNEAGQEIGRLWFSCYGRRNIGYTDNTGVVDTGVGYSLNTWYNYKMIFRSDGWDFYVYNPDGSILVSRENLGLVNSWTEISKLNLRSGKGEVGIAYHDNFRVRKYASVEPSVSVGAEE